MIDVLYTVIIYPITLIIEYAFMIMERVFHNHSISLIGVSITVTICTLPLYFIAEKHQQGERDIQKRLKPEIDKIKAVFKGDEQYLILSTYYRQNHYHPVYAMRNTFGILIQIPFFIAAYTYLSHLELLHGASFLLIRDLGAPDGLIPIDGGINLLPLLMTTINCISGTVYTKGHSVKDKVQVYGIAVVFLILLYNSPAGLVLYWTMNNMFSLLKNVLIKTKHANRIIYLALCAGVIGLIIYFIPRGLSPKRLCLLALCSIVFFIPLIQSCLKKWYVKLHTVVPQPQQTALWHNHCYIYSALILFFLSGLVIPTALIASSVQEFSFIDSYTSPLPFVLHTLIQSAGIFLFWPLCVYFLFTKHIQTRLNFFLSIVSILALVNAFVFPGNFGALTTTFKFSMPDTLESQYTLIIVSAIASIAIISGAAYLLLTRRKVIFTTIQVITLCALTGFGLISLVKINTDFTAFAKRRQDGGQSLENIAPVFKFSKTGKNVLVIMLDRASSGYVPYIFEEKPELFTGFDGFTYYPNCVSFGSHTRIGAPPLFGGYEYIPSLIQKTLTMARTKHNEALLMMPKLFADAGYSATVTDPSLANYSLRPDLSIYSGYPEIHAENILGKYSGEWLKAHSDIQILSISSLLNTLLIRFSFFKIAPPIFRIFLYDKGEWLTIDDNASTELPLDSIDDYTTLDFLPQITVTTAENQNTYTAMVNELTHHPVYLQAPDYVPATIVSNRGTGPFADEPNYHVIIAAFILLENWFNYLREQQVYDNTRIIIVSDHGIGARSAFPNNITLPNGDCIQSYNPILLQKDFNTQGELITDSTFMTNADVPVLATAGLIENPINPFTYIPLQTQKENGVTITTASVLNYTIAPDEWLHVHDNIFDPSNWEKAEVSR